MTNGISLGIGLAAIAGLYWIMPPIPKPEFVKLSCKPSPAPWIEPTCEAPIVPKTIIIRFAGLEEFEKEAGDVPDSTGLADTEKSPCVILLPAIGTIKATPATGYARWDGEATALSQTLPHEILHCLANRWHNEPRAFNGAYTLKWKNSVRGRDIELEDLAYQPPFLKQYGIER